YSVYALDAITGELLWQSTRLDHRIWNFPVIDGDHIYTPSGSFYVLNKSDGLIEHFIDVPGEVMSSAALDDSILYFGNTLGTVYAVDQYKLNNKPESNTTVTLGDIDFSTISNDQITKVDTSFYIYNYGNKNDNISISFSSLSPKIVIPNEAISVDPDYSFELAATDSQKVTITIDVTGLENGNYGRKMRIRSQFNLVQNKFNSSITLDIDFPVSIENNFPNTSPHSYFLKQNYPNPFNPITNLSYQIPSNEKVNLVIYNVLGEKVKILVNDELRAGEYTRQWDGKDMSGKQVQSGMYFCRMQAGNYVKIRKLTLIR
ncbi:MAG: PQQ-binding-like beta-propeller repeat protein, partial [bacterium]